MGISAVLATQVLDTTSVGHSVMTAADQASARTAIGAGTSSFDGVFASLTSRPTTVSGYGITNAYTKTEVDNLVAGLLDFKGNQDCSANPSYPSALKGDAYYVSVAGKIGGPSGVSVDVGDMIVASADNAGGTQASVGTSWFVLEHNLAGTLVSSNNLSDLASAATARTNLGLGTLATQSGTFSGTSSGTNTGDQTTISGNAGSATVLQTARLINGVSFNGSTNITVTAAGSTLSDTVPVSKGGTGLTSLGTALQVLRVNAGATALEFATAGGSGDVVGPSSSTDNAITRFDLATGKLVQDSCLVVDDLATASPNNTTNFACIRPTGGTTNVGLAIVPKGNGAFTLAVPDSASTGGNARGSNAIDLQKSRTAAGQVASGSDCIAIGRRNTASNSDSIAIGNQNISSGTNGYTSIALGSLNTASGDSSTVIGFNASATALFATALGAQSRSDRYGMLSYAANQFAANGDAQWVLFVVRNKTTTNTATTLLLNGSSTRLTITSGKVLSFTARITGIKSDGSAAAEYLRRGVIKNVGGTTALVGTIQTLGTDIEDNASTDVEITADDTNDALQINVTGITAETWRWVAIVEGIEIAYGT